MSTMEATAAKIIDQPIVDQLVAHTSVEMEEVNKLLLSRVGSHVQMVPDIANYLISAGGKRLRPMLTVAAAMMFEPKGQQHISYAAAVEFMHTATLLHDDVVDDSNRRRGFFSVNALWKNKIAVLIGDFLLSKGLLLSIDNNDFDLLKIISIAVREMSEGELLQIEKARKLDITEDIYYEIIRQKTATLIAACCSLGAASVKPESEHVEVMRKFGELIGMAFQIKDDLFDYGNAQIGKPTGIDIKEQKMTLPLIYVLNQASKKDKKWLINSIKNHNKDIKRVKEVIDFVKTNGGLEYAVSKMKQFQEEALQLLRSYPDSQYRASLELMVNYVIDRKK
mgnify:CR=1 FL=1